MSLFNHIKKSNLLTCGVIICINLGFMTFALPREHLFQLTFVQSVCEEVFIFLPFCSSVCLVSLLSFAI